MVLKHVGFKVVCPLHFLRIYVRVPHAEHHRGHCFPSPTTLLASAVEHVKRKGSGDLTFISGKHRQHKKNLNKYTISPCLTPDKPLVSKQIFNTTVGLSCRYSRCTHKSPFCRFAARPEPNYGRGGISGRILYMISSQITQNGLVIETGASHSILDEAITLPEITSNNTST